MTDIVMHSYRAGLSALLNFLLRHSVVYVIYFGIAQELSRPRVILYRHFITVLTGR